MTYGQFRHRRELFTNIPLDENIDICVDQLFGNNDTVEGFTKSELRQLLRLATKREKAFAPSLSVLRNNIFAN